MSFAEMLEGVKLLTLEEKWELHQAVTREINNGGDLMDWFEPGMIAYMTPEMKVDEWVLEKIFNPTPAVEGD